MDADADGQLVAARALGVVDLAPDLGEARDDVAAARQNDLAERRRLNGRGAIEQLHPEFALHIEEALGEARLRDAERFGGAAEMAILGQRGDHFEVVDRVHDGSGQITESC